MKKRLKRTKAVGIALSAAMLLSPTIHSEAQSLVQDTNTQQEQLNIEDTNADQIAPVYSIANGESRTITLLTGDVITVTGVGEGKITIDVKPADGIEDRTRIITIDKETFVFPEKAMPYIAAGQLDYDLFNITKLLEYQYDDTSQTDIPVIVEYKETKVRSFAAAMTPAAPEGSKRTKVLESIHGAAVSADKKHVSKFWKAITPDLDEKELKEQATSVQLDAGIEKIWLDEKVEATLSKSVPQVGAPQAWQLGYDGKGTAVAVLDTGIDASHPDIAPQLDEAVSFVPGEDVKDYNSHGTHVASTVLGTGAASGGQNKGVAPGARLLVGKVLSNGGSGLSSWIIDGMEWASDKAKIVNMSISTQAASDGTDPMAQAVNRLSAEKGTLFVVAAGNNGKEMSVGSPGAADAALTIGAVSKTDRLASFSSQGPRLGDSALKPDLSAPGVAISAARSQYASGSGAYAMKDGTSMATPHVAGAAAIVAQKHPEWTGEQIKQALMSSTKQLPGLQPYQIGTGRLDIPAALDDISATGSLSFGFFDWPHEETAPIERTVTYQNDSDSAIVLDLLPVFTDAKGQPAPEGMLKLSANKVTVPAKGSASITVSLDVQKGALGTKYQGQLSANQNGKTVAHTAMGMMKEEERYTLDLRALDRDGSPNIAYTLVYNLETGEPKIVTVAGSTQLRLPKGTYSITSLMDVDMKTDHMGVAFVGDPEFELTQDAKLDLDGQAAREIQVQTPKKAEATSMRIEYTRVAGGKGTGDMWQLPITADKMYAMPADKVENGSFEVAMRWRMIKPMLSITLQDKELDVLPQLGSVNLTGNYALPVVYAGKGAVSDYNNLDAQGKMVIVERSDEVTASQRAQAARNAGAKLLITVNDKPQELAEIYTTTSGEAPLAIASISGTEGAVLVKAARTGHLTLDVKATANTPYLYDLVKAYTDEVPNGEGALLYAPKPNELTRLDSKYYSDRPVTGTEWRFDFRPYRSVDRKLAWFPLSAPFEREEWVSAIEGSTWYQKAQITDQGSEYWEMRGKTDVSYQAGEKLANNWFKPVVAPAFGPGFISPYRITDMLYLNTKAWGDSEEGHAGFFSGQTTQSKLYKEGTLIAQTNSDALISYSSLISKERKQYTLVSDSERNSGRWNTSTKTHTEWTFWSEYTKEKEVIPMLNLRYDVDTDLAGNVPAGSVIDLTLSASHVANAKGAGNIEDVTLEVSFDEGQTWQPTKLTRQQSKWVTRIKNPSQPGGSVSLRASAQDDAGNSIKQDIIKAYRLR
ncbi:S8 family serine peptidase [Ectobacillus sp. JY-23]|uniref:S8 family serine peptidase n=1 Tax=Ectobacillus sp. JY-23 TaxID=2933872 RepID=UPI001FF5558F|nr:S8 family serine peptidase [Ectobacillus sp. JY-23]UOY91738.1 S8 family serine peptidase [Ectobacillus sp. JY-23]